MRLYSRTLLQLLATLAVLPVLAVPARAADIPSIDRVWSLEDSYWRYVRAGDAESYLTLWDPDFIGWPCRDEHPATKAAIDGWVRRIHDQKVRFSYDLVRERAADFGDIIIVYYHTKMVSEFPDGHVTGGDRMFKFVHTWRRTGSDWKIIGGMCGPLEVSKD